VSGLSLLMLAVTTGLVGVAVRLVAHDAAARRRFPDPASPQFLAADAPGAGRPELHWRDLCTPSTDTPNPTGRAARAPRADVDDLVEQEGDGDDGQGLDEEFDVDPDSEVWGWTAKERREALEAARTGSCCWVIHYAGWDGGRELCGDDIQPGYIFCPDHLFELHEGRDVPDRFSFEALGLWRYLRGDEADEQPFDPAAYEANLPLDSSDHPAFPDPSTSPAPAAPAARDDMRGAGTIRLGGFEAPFGGEQR
jgi:hypothetical protein